MKKKPGFFTLSLFITGAFFDPPLHASPGTSNGHSTVDAKTATWTNTIGNAELLTVWKDPHFDPSVRAFYYARVIEIPTPRWTTYDAARFGEEISRGAPVSLQERAYTSPIWYSPES